MQTSSEIDIARGDTQDCLMRLILQVDPLQSSTTDFLLEKMAEFVMDSDKLVTVIFCNTEKQKYSS